jgi:hypothetical protein
MQRKTVESRESRVKSKNGAGECKGQNSRPRTIRLVSAMPSRNPILGRRLTADG